MTIYEISVIEKKCIGNRYTTIKNVKNCYDFCYKFIQFYITFI